MLMQILTLLNPSSFGQFLFPFQVVFEVGLLHSLGDKHCDQQICVDLKEKERTSR